MRPSARSAAILAAALLATAPARAAEAPDPEVVARDAVRELVDGKYDDVEARFSSGMKAEVPRERLAETVDPLRRERGPARSVTARLRHDLAEGLVEITVKANWSRGPVTEAKVTVKPDGTIVGLLIKNEQRENDGTIDAYEVKAKLRPPFKGTWTAHNAARDPSNPHWTIRSQRHAVDWVMEGADGKPYRTDGKKNQDYLAWGQEALAVADGTVAVVVDGVPENPAPGLRDTYFIPGNHVVIDLGNSEYAMYMHLVPGSIPVKVGQKVKAGDVVGKVGNSGNSTEPHLHFQLADKPRFVDCAALPARFTDAILDGKKTARAWPTEKSRLAAE
jgi:murein DD-endopeptidase MepM/ murein hydrolase activator NlpD